MLCLLRVILSTSGVPFTIAAQQYQKECYKHQRKGGPIRVVPMPDRLGRAADTSAFIKDLHDRYHSYFPKMRYARDFVTRLKAGALLDPHEQQLLMSGYSAWVTWESSGPASDPFGFLVHGLAIEVRAALGLDQRLTGPLLLLRYTRPAAVRLYRPTVADAGLFPYFDPPLTTESCVSYTRPWPAFRVPGNPAVEVIAPPRREAVHRPVKFASLSLPVDELR
jgi:hypothetical protein